MRLLEIIPYALESIKGLVREMPTIPKKDTERRDLSYKASSDTLKAVGIMPSPVPSFLITNIYQQRNLTLHTVVEDVISNYSDLLMDYDDGDGDPTDSKKKE